MTTATIIPLPLKMKERRAAIQKALNDANWNKTIDFLRFQAAFLLDTGHADVGANLLLVIDMIKEKLKGDAGNGPAKPSA